jgi:integrase
MAKKLTTKSIENVKPAPQRREISDGGSGLYLIVQPSGHRSWAVRYRHQGVPAKLTLGSWPALTLAGARKAAAEALHERERGNDPAATKEAAKLKAAEAKADTLAAVCASYLKREGGKLRTIHQRVSILNRLVLPVLGDRPLSEIRRSEIVALLDKIEDENGQRMADVTLAVLRKVLHWHELRDENFRSPIIRGMSRWNAKEHRRARILDDNELRALWTAAEGPFGVVVRLLLLTAARRSEVAAMRWGELDAEGVWTLPAARSKTKTDVPRPLSRAALSLLKEQPQIDGCDFVFTTNGVSAITSFSEPKAKLDAASGVSNWRLHDLRRTARSLLSRAGVNVDIAERCLGHAMPVIRATYDRHRYIEEMSHAFEALAALIERIVNPADNTVVALRR